jgi:hypothetical protein
MTVQEQVEHWVTMNVMDEVMLADGFEEAFLGVSEVFGRPPLATYDKEKCIDILVERDGMTYEEAVEYFEFNVSGSWVGDSTPIYLTLWKAGD